MSSTIFETAAIIRLVDELSGPLHALEAKVAAHQSRAMAGAQRLQGVGRAMAFGVSLPIEEAFRHMSNSALEFSKVENTLQGVLTNRARTMGLSTEAAGQWVKSQKEILDVQTKLAVQRGHGLVNPLEFAKGAMSGTKAGLDMEAATAAAETATRLALAGRIKQHEALDMAITAGNQFGVQFKDENGVQFAADKITAQYAKIGDLLTTMATNANMTLTQAAESVSLSAPIARAIGMDPGVLGAMSETQAEAGFKGKEASVAQRSLLMALTAPKSTAIPAFKSAGINYFDYATFKPEALLQTTPEGFEQYAKNKGLKISHADTVEAFKSARDEVGPNGKIQSYLGDYIVGVLKRSGSKESPVTPDLAMKYANNYLTQGVDKINVPGLIQAIRAAGMTLGQLKGVVEPRQIPRLLPFLRDPNQAHSNADLTKEAVKEYGKNWQTKVPELKQYLDSHKDGSKNNEFDTYSSGMKRMFGEDWKKQIESGQTTPLYLGNMERQALEHAEGYEGALKRIETAFVGIEAALYTSGFWDQIATDLNVLSNGINSLAAIDPGVIRHIADALVALAVVGPMLWAGGKLLAVVSVLLKLGAAIAGIEEAGAAAVAVTALAKGAKALAAAEIVLAAGGAAEGVAVLSTAATVLLSIAALAVPLGATLAVIAALVKLHKDELPMAPVAPDDPANSLGLPGIEEPGVGRKLNDPAWSNMPWPKQMFQPGDVPLDYPIWSNMPAPSMGGKPGELGTPWPSTTGESPPARVYRYGPMDKAFPSPMNMRYGPQNPAANLGFEAEAVADAFAKAKYSIVEHTADAKRERERAQAYSREPPFALLPPAFPNVGKPGELGSHDGTSQIVGAIQSANSKPVPVDVKGTVEGKASLDVHVTFSDVLSGIKSLISSEINLHGDFNHGDQGESAHVPSPRVEASRQPGHRGHN